jgi:hypothetical protein
MPTSEASAWKPRSRMSTPLDLVIAGANRVRFDELDGQLIERIATEHGQEQEQEGVRRFGDVTPKPLPHSHFPG